jgi:hypothetical protein
MKIEQTRWSQTQGGDPGHPGTLGNEAQHRLTFAGDLSQVGRVMITTLSESG